MIFDVVRELLEEQLGVVSPKLSVPVVEEHGDVAFACHQYAKEYRKSPQMIAEEFSRKLSLPSLLSKVVALGGFLNFFVNKQELARVLLPKIDESYGSLPSKKERVVIDYSSVNIAKPFSIGHLRSTVIGNALCRMYKFQGWSVVGVNHLGDWGTQFGKLIVAFNEWGDKKQLDADPISHLLELYVRFHKEAENDPGLEERARETFARLEKGDKKSLQLWKLFRKLSLREFRKMYSLLDVDFDEWLGESFYNDKTGAVVKLFEEKNLSKRDQGALIVPFDDLPPLLLQKTNGASTYHSRDIAAALYRMNNLKGDRLVYVVGQEQKLHFEQLFKALVLLGYPSTMFEHVSFGHFQLSEGKMSTRKGNVIFLEDVLEQAIARVEKIIGEKNPSLKKKQEVATIVGIGGIIFGDLINDRLRDIVFDWDRILSFEGDTGPYAQYTYARLCSILRKSKGEGCAKKKVVLDFRKLFHPSEEKLLLCLESFPGIIVESLATNHPHIIAQYIIRLCRASNEFYHSCAVLGTPEEAERLEIVMKTSLVIKTGLWLLGVKTVEEM